MKPEIEIIPDGYRLTWPGVEALVERLSEHSDELSCEVSISTDLPPTPGLLHWGRVNLSSEQTRSRLAVKLQKRQPDPDWGAILEQMCVMVADRHRRGEPAVDLRDVVPSLHSRWLIEPFVELAGPTVLFADGGTGKSLTALAMACGLAAGVSIIGTVRGEAAPVLYLDWETDRETTAERMRAICWGAGIGQLPAVHYRRQVANLESAVPELRREAHRLGAALVVVDSLGAARGGEPESADLTIRTFNAARALAVPVLMVDHVTKAAGNTSPKSFGSVYTHNLARITWSMDKAQDEGERKSTILLINRKRNNGRLCPKIALEMTVEADDDGVLAGIYFKTVDAAGSAVADRLGLRERIWAALSGSGSFLLTVKELSELLGATENAVRARLSEMLRTGSVVKEGDAWRRVEQ